MADLTAKSSGTSMSSGSRLWAALQQLRMTYALALGLVAVVFIIRTLLAPTLENQALYLFLMPTVLIAGILGGWGPGLLATFLSLVLHLYTTGEFSNLNNPGSPLFAAELARAATFTLLGVGIAWFGDQLRYTRTQAAVSTGNA